MTTTDEIMRSATLSTIDGMKRCIDALEAHARELDKERDDQEAHVRKLESQRPEIFIRGFEMGSSNDISLPEALESEFGDLST